MRKTLPTLVAIALLLGGCGGGDDGGENSADESTTTSTAAVGDTTTPDSGTATPAPGQTTGRSGSSATTAKAGATSTGSGSRPASARVGAAAGTYRYAKKGTSSVSGGYTASKPVDTKYEAKAEAAKGQEQRTVCSGSCLEKETVTRFSEAGAELTSFKVMHGNKERTFVPSPPAPIAPKPATPGRAWSWSTTSTDGQATITAQGKVLRAERITAGGESVDTVVYELTVSTKTPEMTRTEKRTVWWSDKHGLMVKQQDITDTDQSGFRVHTDTTTTIESLKP